MTVIGPQSLVKEFQKSGSSERFFQHWVAGSCGLLAEARQIWQKSGKVPQRRDRIADLVASLQPLFAAGSAPRSTARATAVPLDAEWQAPLQARLDVLQALVAASQEEANRLLQQAVHRLASDAWNLPAVPEALQTLWRKRFPAGASTWFPHTSALARIPKSLPLRNTLLALENSPWELHPALLLVAETCACVTGKEVSSPGPQECRRVPISLVETPPGKPAQGRLAWLTVERVSGGAGALVPHPLKQAYFLTRNRGGEENFLESLLRGWWRSVGHDLVFGKQPDFDIWWSLESPEPGPYGETWRPNIAGFSADVAIANAVRALRDHDEIDSRIVVSASFAEGFPATLDPREEIEPVQGLGEKLTRACLAAGESEPEVTEFVTSVESEWLKPSPKHQPEAVSICEVGPDRKERSFGQGLTLIGVRTAEQQWEVVNTGAKITKKVKQHLARRAGELLTAECGVFVEPHLLVWQQTDESRPEAQQQRIAGDEVKQLLLDVSGSAVPGTGSRLAIRGDSGLGKSMLLVWAEQLLAEDPRPIIPLRFGAAPKQAESPGYGGQTRLPGWGQVLRVDPTQAQPDRTARLEQTLYDWLVRDLLGEAGVDENDATRRQWFGQKLRRGEICWVMDALDQSGESAESGLRCLLGEPWRRCAALLTARREISTEQRQGYGDAARWREVDVAEFNRHQIEQFLADETVRRRLLIQNGDDWDTIRRKQQWQELLKFPILARQLRDLAREAERGGQRSLDNLTNREAVYHATLGQLLEQGKQSLTPEEKATWASWLKKTQEIATKLQEAAWVSLTASATASPVEPQQQAVNAGFDGELRAQAYDTLQDWLDQTKFPEELLKKVNLLKHYEEELETAAGGETSYARWRHKSFGEWFAGQHLVRSGQARNQLAPLLRDARWRDTVRYALSAAARQGQTEVLHELVRTLISQGRVFWVWEALSEDALGCLDAQGKQTAHGPQNSPNVGLQRDLELLCRWLVHRDWGWSEGGDGRGAWGQPCPLQDLESTVDLWPSLFDRRVREGRVLFAAWELVELGRRSSQGQVREVCEEIRRKFLAEWRAIQRGEDPVNGAALNSQQLAALQSLAWDPKRDRKPVNRHQPVTGPRYCRVPPEGAKHRFVMGSPRGEPGLFDNEAQKPEEVEAFWLGNFPVTNGVYELYDPGHRERRTKYSSGDLQPVVNLSRYEAEMLCVWLGGEYRLPTEAEWEAACRAGTQTAYWYGTEPEQLAEHAWFAKNSAERTHHLQESLAKGQRPGQGHVNEWGLVDMHGNVWEWCAGVAPLGQPCPYRGGSWGNGARDCQAAFRNAIDPENRDDDLGLRLVPSPSGRQEGAQPEA